MLIHNYEDLMTKNLKIGEYEYVTDKYKCLKDCEILAIFVPWDEFKEIDTEKFKKSFSGKLIFRLVN